MYGNLAHVARFYSISPRLRGEWPGDKATIQALDYYLISATVDREIFTLKIIRVIDFRVGKFLRFRSIPEIFLRKMFYSHDKVLPRNYFRPWLLPPDNRWRLPPLNGYCHRIGGNKATN